MLGSSLVIPSGKIRTDSPSAKRLVAAANMSVLSWPERGTTAPPWTDPGAPGSRPATPSSGGRPDSARSCRRPGSAAAAGSTDISTMASAAPPKWFATNRTGPSAARCNGAGLHLPPGDRGDGVDEAELHDVRAPRSCGPVTVDPGLALQMSARGRRPHAPAAAAVTRCQRPWTGSSESGCTSRPCCGRQVGQGHRPHPGRRRSTPSDAGAGQNATPVHRGGGERPARHPRPRSPGGRGAARAAELGAVVRDAAHPGQRHECAVPASGGSAAGGEPAAALQQQTPAAT